MVQDVKDLGAELHVEVLRDTPDVVILEDGKIQVGDARTRQDISARIATEVWTSQISDTVPSLTIIRSPKSRIGCSGDCKALCLDVVVRISWISEALTSGAAEPIRKGPIVVVLGKSGIVTSPPRCREWHAVANRQDGAKFPSIGEPSSRSRE